MDDLNSYLMEQIILENGFEAYSVKQDETDLNPRRLENLGKINIFVGANNSGKSRLIRTIARNPTNVFEPLKVFRPQECPVRDFHVIGKMLMDPLGDPNDHNYIKILERWTEVINQSKIKGIVEGKRSLGNIKTFLVDTSEATHLDFGLIHSYHDRLSKLKRSAKNSLEKLESLFDLDERQTKFKHIYIPTIRSLRDLGGKDILKDRTITDYQLSQVSVFTGQTLYEEVELLLRGNLAEREKLQDFEKWIGDTFFEGRSFALIPRHKQTTLTIKIGDEAEKPIHELGDGIQSILILTFELFRHSDEYVLAFIEEPELFLHPWLQRAFLEMLSSRFPKHQYFLTTHSNHFLDMTLDVPDVSVFTLEKDLDHTNAGKEKDARFTVRQISREDRKPLELLGVRNSSVLLSNCTIWVEGITDRRYIAHWLKLYNEDQATNMANTGQHRIFKEDLHYSFVEYGGGNITHFSFLDDDESAEAENKRINVERLCSKLFLITDQDGAKEGTAKANRQAILNKRLGDHYYCLQGREIENLISPEVLAAVLRSYGEEIVTLPAYSQYKSKQLGTFIDGFLAKGGHPRKRKGSYAQASGTITDKVNFCHKTVEFTKVWGDLSEDAQELTAKLYRFIQHMNQ